MGEKGSEFNVDDYGAAHDDSGFELPLPFSLSNLKTPATPATTATTATTATPVPPKHDGAGGSVLFNFGSKPASTTSTPPEDHTTSSGGITFSFESKPNKK